ncbi:phospholipase [Hymenobacter taeanensis]|uniref:Phospholipase n=1 Tax=Hymenobacter taeanensis TaxID=2735321 RepID=A0A6M6BJY7_9BACT|nr:MULTISPECIES: alpha/beta hydrolase [Hymenobacter]QJX48406.1 phospholipase [Hymenobacter taeanensis]UOQ82099.1 alpha/beta hydrolase [Hymenobacter sp. 5414T-23]
MAAQENHLPVTRTARYYQLGILSGSTRRIWFVCHGYGQLAAYFIRHFTQLTDADPDLVVIAPEGLSRFYLQGTGGRVGATWMTREDRLTEIDDYVNYLNQLADLVLAETGLLVPVTVLGFSQGAATVSRWLSRAHFKPAHLILWAGAFPPDMEFPVATRLLQNLSVTLVCGDEDEFIRPEHVVQQQDFLRKLGVEAQILSFAGKHTLNGPILRRLAGLDQLPA